MTDPLILVDTADRAIGLADKVTVHRQGLLHRAFSIFLFDHQGQLLLQRRAPGKYHSGGLWSNTCCSHPYPEESLEAAAARRLMEEMGIACPLTRGFDFIYQAKVGDDLFEHEFDHVFIGRYQGAVQPDAEEVAAYRWRPISEVVNHMQHYPWQYTAWFGLALERVVACNQDLDIST